MMSRTVCVLILFSLLLIGGCHTMNTPPSAPLPVTYHPAGRYLLAVPQGMKYAGMYHTINYIHVEETAWERGDRAGQFHRITSYNVCYTKLLRAAAGPRAVAGLRGPAVHGRRCPALVASPLGEGCPNALFG